MSCAPCADGCILRFILYNIKVVEGENPLSALFLSKIKIKYYFTLIIKKLCLPLQYNNKDNNNLNKFLIMKTIWFNNEALKEVLAEQGIEMMCDENMNIVISDEDAERIPALVEEFAPAAAGDYGIED